MITTTNKQKNKMFVATICLIVALIALIIPSTLAWFTDTDTDTSSTTISFGSVDIEISENPEIDHIKYDTTSKTIKNILPGDTFDVTLNFYNKGTVPVYAYPMCEVAILYDDKDITDCFDTTSANPELTLENFVAPETQIFEFSDKSSSNVIKLDANQTEDSIGTGEINLRISFTGKLGNSVTDGINTYWLNKGAAPQPSTVKDYKIQFNTKVSAIQQDNYDATLTDASATATQKDNAITSLKDELQRLIDPDLVSRNFGYEAAADGSSDAQLTINDKPVKGTHLNSGTTFANNTIQLFEYEENDLNCLVVVGEDEVGSDIGTFLATYAKPIDKIIIGHGIESVNWGDLPDSVKQNFKIVVFSETVTSIGDNSFADSNLSDIIFYGTSNLKTIGDYAFASNHLREIYIPKNVTHIGSCAFTPTVYVYSPSKIVVEEGNANYKVVSGCLIENNSKIILLAKNHLIPKDENITQIAGGAFRGSEVSTVIPRNIEYVGGNNFWQAIYLESSSTTIGPTIGLEMNDTQVYYYSDTYSEGYWHYDTDGITPIMWEPAVLKIFTSSADFELFFVEDLNNNDNGDFIPCEDVSKNPLCFPIPDNYVGFYCRIPDWPNANYETGEVPYFYTDTLAFAVLSNYNVYLEYVNGIPTLSATPIN